MTLGKQSLGILGSLVAEWCLFHRVVIGVRQINICYGGNKNNWYLKNAKNL